MNNFHKFLVLIFFFSLLSSAFPLEQQWGLGEVYDASFSPDGDWIVTVTSVGVQVWDARAEPVMHNRRNFDYKIDYAKWSPDGTMLALISEYSGTQLIVNFPTLDTITEIESDVHVNKINTGEFRNFDVQKHKIGLLLHSQSVNFSPDSNSLGLITKDFQIQVVDVMDGSMNYSKQYDLKLDSLFFLSNDVIISNIEEIRISDNTILNDGYGENVVLLSPNGDYLLRISIENYKDIFTGSLLEIVFTHLFNREEFVNLATIQTGVLAASDGMSHAPQRYVFHNTNDQSLLTVYSEKFSSDNLTTLELTEKFSRLKRFVLFPLYNSLYFSFPDPVFI